jgi:hypothetical protein
MEALPASSPHGEYLCRGNFSTESTAIPNDASAAEVVSAVSSLYDDAFATSHETLIFLDFDDTMFPTTEIFDRWNFPTDPEKWPYRWLSAIQKESLQRWEDALLNYLQTMRSLSDRVVLLSHASPGWIENCLRFFAPAVSALLERDCGLHVVYARRSFGIDDGDADELHALLTSSKHQAMWREACRFYGRSSGRTWKNMISVGDMPYEAEALRHLGFRRQGPPEERLRLKALRCQQHPSIAEMIARLLTESLLMPLVVRHDGDLDVALSGDRLGLPTFAEHLACPELAEIQVPAVAETLLGSPCMENIIDQITIGVQHRLM